MAGLPWDLRQANLNKAELHLHLEGSIEPDTLRAIDPALTREEIASRFAHTDFVGFLKAYIWVTQRLQSPEHYAIATRDLISRLARQNVIYAEITLSAGVVLWKKQDLGAIYDAVWRESRRAPFPVLWILDAVRQFDPQDGMRVAKFAVSRKDGGVVGFGIGGDEERGPAKRFVHVFRFARDGGLRLTCHAGETTGPRSIWDALEVGAERIGHGIAAIQDPALVAHLRDKGIPLEVCITSNVRTGVVASLADHPVRKLFDAGVPIVLNTDDPGLFETTLDGEYKLARDQFCFTEEELALLAENSLRYAFRRSS